jgi:hypothetical protein
MQDNHVSFLRVYSARQFLFCADDTLPIMEKLMRLGHVKVVVKGNMNEYMTFVDIHYRFIFSEEFANILRGLETEKIFDGISLFGMVLNNTYLYEDLPASLRLWIALQEEPQ